MENTNHTPSLQQDSLSWLASRFSNEIDLPFKGVSRGVDYVFDSCKNKFQKIKKVLIMSNR